MIVAIGRRVEYQTMKSSAVRTKDALDLFYPALHGDSQVLPTTGLGLGLPCRIIKEHGGRMTLNIDEEGMTLISVHLPGDPP